MPSAAPLPVGPLTTPLHRLAQMLSECHSFQTRVGLTYPDATAEAKLVNGDASWKRIYYPALETDPNTGLYPLDTAPLAVISFGDEWQIPLVSVGARNYSHGPRGSLVLELFDKCRYPTNLEAGTRDFANWVGLVIESGNDSQPGLWELAALNDRLTINSISQLEPPQLYERTEEAARDGRFRAAKFLVRYGVGG